MKTASGLWVTSTAVFSEDEAYRYSLIREWDPTKGHCCFVMLNPSKATATVNDPTVARCMGFAERWGFGSLQVVNLFALRSTDPRALYTHTAPIGEEFGTSDTPSKASQPIRSISRRTRGFSGAQGDPNEIPLHRR